MKLKCSNCNASPEFCSCVEKHNPVCKCGHLFSFHTKDVLGDTGGNCVFERRARSAVPEGQCPCETFILQVVGPATDEDEYGFPEKFVRLPSFSTSIRRPTKIVCEECLLFISEHPDSDRCTAHVRGPHDAMCMISARPHTPGPVFMQFGHVEGLFVLRGCQRCGVVYWELEE